MKAFCACVDVDDFTPSPLSKLWKPGGKHKIQTLRFSAGKTSQQTPRTGGLASRFAPCLHCEVRFPRPGCAASSQFLRSCPRYQAARRTSPSAVLPSRKLGRLSDDQANNGIRHWRKWVKAKVSQTKFTGRSSFDKETGQWMSFIGFSFVYRGYPQMTPVFRGRLSNRQ